MEPSFAVTVPSSRNCAHLRGGELGVRRLLVALDDELAVRRVREVRVDLLDDLDALGEDGVAERDALRRGRPVEHRDVTERGDRPSRPPRPRTARRAGTRRTRRAALMWCSGMSSAVEEGLAARRSGRSRRPPRPRPSAPSAAGRSRAGPGSPGCAPTATPCRLASATVLRHRHRIAAVEAAGDVRRGDEGHDLLVGAHHPVPEALAHVAVEVERRQGRRMAVIAAPPAGSGLSAMSEPLFASSRAAGRRPARRALRADRLVAGDRVAVHLPREVGLVAASGSARAPRAGRRPRAPGRSGRRIANHDGFAKSTSRPCRCRTRARRSASSPHVSKNWLVVVSVIFSTMPTTLAMRPGQDPARVDAGMRPGRNSELRCGAAGRRR